MQNNDLNYNKYFTIGKNLNLKKILHLKIQKNEF